MKHMSNIQNTNQQHHFSATHNVTQGSLPGYSKSLLFYLAEKSTYRNPDTTSLHSSFLPEAFSFSGAVPEIWNQGAFQHFR